MQMTANSSQDASKMDRMSLYPKMTHQACMSASSPAFSSSRTFYGNRSFCRACETPFEARWG